MKQSDNYSFYGLQKVHKTRIIFDRVLKTTDLPIWYIMCGFKSGLILIHNNKQIKTFKQTTFAVYPHNPALLALLV